MMADYPIIFSGPMVKALLDGRKTMTRRLAWRLAKQPDEVRREGACEVEVYKPRPTIWQKVRPGDRLYVRESFAFVNAIGSPAKATDRSVTLIYKADPKGTITKYRPSIHMPRTASRLTLTVTATKIERLQEISEDDAKAEGCPGWYSPCHPDQGVTDGRLPHEEFADLWNRLHGPGAWEANPEVVAMSFEVHKANIDSMEKAA